MRMVFIIFLFIFSCLLFAQDVYVNKSSQDKYLFLGSVGNNKKKLLNVKDNTILWMEDDKLQQVDKLSPWEFAKKIFESRLAFYVSGDEPFWEAVINKDHLWFLKPTSLDGKSELVKIKTVINKYTSDNQFILMFNSVNHSSYGVIRGLTVDSICENSINEDNSIFEVIINYQGEIFNGCAMLEYQKN